MENIGKVFLFGFVLLPLAVTRTKGECNEPLLKYAKLTATSSVNSDRGPDKAHLYGPSAWTAGSSDFSQYLIIELDRIFIITAIATQGRGHTNEYVPEYMIEYGNNNLDYSSYKDRGGSTKLFEGNSDGTSIKRNEFETPIIAQWVRINPTRWGDRISMRVELYGCKYEAKSVNFDGFSYFSLDLRNRPVASQEDEIRFRFRTNHADGVILYGRGTQGDVLALQLVANQLLLSVDLGGEGILTGITVGGLLDDNLWHDVWVNRKAADVTFTVDRMVVKQRIRGDFVQLDLNRELYVGGVPLMKHDGLAVVANFTGCIENLFINSTSVFTELEYDRGLISSKTGNLPFVCQYEKVTPVTFTTSEAHIKVPGSMQTIMNCSFDFRTFNEDGTLLYNEFSSTGFVRLFLDKGKLKIELRSQEPGSPKVLIEPSDALLNDGRWHKTVLVLNKDRIELHLDWVPSKTIRQFSMTTGRTYLLGGGVPGYSGFIGCMRYIYIEGRYIDVTSLSPDQYSEIGVFIDSCQMVDRCSPNPCEHGGTCKQNWEEFECNCEHTGYTGAVCHIPKSALSCEAYWMYHPKARTVDISIDIDWSGPLKPFNVTCEFLNEGPVRTILHHKNEQPTEVKGFSQPGSFIQDIMYNADMEQLVHLVNRSYSCRQNLRYECYKARLFNSPSPPGATFEPMSWWVSQSNQKMDYWGGSLPGSRKCNCGLFGTCKDPSRWCNCDAPNVEEWLMDEGEITQKEYLPVRQLRFGDTGTALDNKKGRYTLGPLICEGDSLFDNTVTFNYEDATIELPPFDMGHAGDIYFQFKTTAEKGVFLHARGPTDFIHVMIVDGNEIRFQYQAGSSPLGASVPTAYKLNDDKWHSVLIERNRKEAKVVVDGTLVGWARELQGPVRVLHLTSKLVLGATLDYREGFVGCMRALMLNGQIVDLKGLAERGLYGISPGCVGKCVSNPCLNNGTCLEGYSSYYCDCQWTAFKGPICADEIGVNLVTDSYIRYNFETKISTLEEYIRVGFTTTDARGMILGVSSEKGEYLNLMMSTSGHLRLVFDFGFERQEIVIKNENFALGQHHDIEIKRTDRGSKLRIKVDNYEPIVHTFKIGQKADAQFNSLKSIYIGRNESMDTGEGFLGCISRVQFDDHFPIRRLFEESHRANVRAFPETIREDTCGIEPVTHPPETTETRPPPTLPPGVYVQPRVSEVDDSAILGGVLAILVVALVLMAIIIGRYMARHKGEYKTHEDKGAKDAPDADTAVIQGKTGPDVTKKKEWFI